MSKRNFLKVTSLFIVITFVFSFNSILSSASNSSKVHFINTGNSDSILVQNNGENVLIDGGDTDDDATVVSYLKKQNVKKIKYIIVSHPHADHIGALDSVIKNFKIERIFVGAGTSNSKTYGQFKTVAKNKKLKLVKPVENTVYKVGKGELKFFNTNGANDGNLNNFSLITKYTNGNDDFVFSGDAEKVVEAKYASQIGKVEVLKLGHHASRTASSNKYLNSLKPQFAVALTGKNSYGHPHSEIMNRLKTKKIKLFRSDESGNIVATSTGNKIIWNTKADSYKANGNTSSNASIKKNTFIKNNSSSKKYFYTPSGTKYHSTKACRTLSHSKTILSGTLKQIKAIGKDSHCKVCK